MNFRKQPRSFDDFDAWYVHMEEYKEAFCRKRAVSRKEEAKAVVLQHCTVPKVRVSGGISCGCSGRQYAAPESSNGCGYPGRTPSVLCGHDAGKDKLYLYYAKERYGQELSCSRFIEELRGDGTPKPGQEKKGDRRYDIKYREKFARF